MDEFKDIGVQLSVKKISVMYEVQDGLRDVTTKIAKQPLEREVIEIQKISKKIKD